MYRTSILVLLLVSAPWLPGQEKSSSQAKSGPTAMEGCLSYASGQYFLIDSGGAKLELSGSTNKLKDHIGHEVQITGKSSTKTVEATSYGAASSADVFPVFEVKSVKPIAGDCASK
jgi:hypothetical protein